MLLPGLVDTHVHFPQIRVIGGLGKPLLSWLDGRALPEEARMSDVNHAGVIAADFVDGLARAGTTTALVFGAHFAPAVDLLFERAAAVGLRVTAGLVVGDRNLRPELEVSAERAYSDGRSLAERWHGKERLRYAVTPRFSLATTPGLLESCAALLRDVDGALFTSHVNENPAEVAAVAKLFPECAHYVDTYDRFALLGRRSVLAHSVHPTDAELDVLAGTGASVAHCPSSNSALGSGLFPLRRHVERGVRVALGTDVGAGTGFSLLREGLQAYFMQALPRATRSRPRTCSGWRRGPGRPRWTSPTSATSPSAASSTPSGCARRRAARSTGCSATPTTPTTRWPRSSPWPAPQIYAARGWRAARSVCYRRAKQEFRMTERLKVYAVNCSILFTELPLLERPAAAKQAGFDAVEFWWPWPVAVPADAEIDGFVAAVTDAGVQLIGLNFAAGDMAGRRPRPVSWPARSGEFRDNVDVTVGIGERLGCRAFNALYGNRIEGVSAAEQDALGRREPRARRARRQAHRRHRARRAGQRRAALPAAHRGRRARRDRPGGRRTTSGCCWTSTTSPSTATTSTPRSTRAAGSGTCRSPTPPAATSPAPAACRSSASSDDRGHRLRRPDRTRVRPRRAQCGVLRLVGGSSGDDGDHA